MYKTVYILENPISEAYQSHIKILNSLEENFSRKCSYHEQ